MGLIRRLLLMKFKELMDKLRKFLRKLSRKEQEEIEALMLRVQQLDLQGLDVKPLQGMKDVYRVRKGKLRVIYKSYKNRGIIIAIDYRKSAYR